MLFFTANAEAPCTTFQKTPYKHTFDDDLPLNKTFYDLTLKGYGCPEACFYNHIPNIQKNQPIPGTKFKGLKMLSTQAPCKKNTTLCKVTSQGITYNTTWSGSYFRTKDCYLYGKFDWEVYAESFNAY